MFFISKKFAIFLLLTPLLATSLALAESNLDEDARFQVRSFALAKQTGVFSALMPDGQTTEESNPACQVAGTLDGEAFYFRVESMRSQSITAQVLWGTERSEPISLELSGEEEGVKVYSWFNGLFATSRIRVFTQQIQGGWTGVRVEAKAGWWKRPFSPLNAVCYFDDGEGERQAQPRIKSSSESASEDQVVSSSIPLSELTPQE